MGKILLNYEAKHKLNTVSGLINRWAPPVENDTNSYAEHVAEKLGLDVDERIDVKQHLQGLCLAIIQHENGVQPYDIATVQRGIEMAQGVA